MENTNKMKRHSRLGFDNEGTKNVVKALNLLLVNYHAHYMNLRNFHWNIKGDDFFELHEKFELIYTRVSEDIDDVAERIRVFDKTPVSTLSEIVKKTQIKEHGTKLNSKKMASAVLSDFEILLDNLVSVLELSSKTSDFGTTEMMTKQLQAIEQDFWMLGAWLKKDD